MATLQVWVQEIACMPCAQVLSEPGYFMRDPGIIRVAICDAPASQGAADRSRLGSEELRSGVASIPGRSALVAALEDGRQRRFDLGVGRVSPLHESTPLAFGLEMSRCVSLRRRVVFQATAIRERERYSARIGQSVVHARSIVERTLDERRQCAVVFFVGHELLLRG